MTQINLTEVLPGDPREWSPRDKPNVKNYSFKVKDDKGTVYEISTKGDPPKLGVGEFNVTPPKPGTSFPPKLSRVFSGGGGGGRGRSPEETKAIQRQHSQEMAVRVLAFGGDRPTGPTREDLCKVIKWWTDWFEADIGSGLGGGASSGGAASIAPAPLPPQNAAAESSAADSGRKGATSRRMTTAGIADRDTQKAIVHAFCGDVATVEGLDAIDAALASHQWHLLFDEQGIERPSDFPDTRDLIA